MGIDSKYTLACELAKMAYESDENRYKEVESKAFKMTALLTFAVSCQSFFTIWMIGEGRNAISWCIVALFISYAFTFRSALFLWKSIKGSSRKIVTVSDEFVKGLHQNSNEDIYYTIILLFQDAQKHNSHTTSRKTFHLTISLRNLGYAYLFIVILTIIYSIQL